MMCLPLYSVPATVMVSLPVSLPSPSMTVTFFILKAGQALELAGDDAVLVVTNLSHIDGLEGGVYTVL